MFYFIMIVISVIFIAGWCFNFAKEIYFFACAYRGFAFGQMAVIRVKCDRALWIGLLKSFGSGKSK